MHHLKDENGTLITDRVEIANTLGAAIENSSSENYATFLLRLSIYYWTSSMKHGKVTHFWNHGEKL